MTAEEFFRKKIKEKYPRQEIVTLSDNLITAEDGMRWAYEFSQLPQHLYTEQQIREAIFMARRQYMVFEEVEFEYMEEEIIQSLKQPKKD